MDLNYSTILFMYRVDYEYGYSRIHVPSDPPITTVITHLCIQGSPEQCRAFLSSEKT